MLLQLNETEIENTRKNVYKVENNSWVDQAFQKYVGIPLVKLLPPSVWPNHITLVGFVPFFLCSCLAVHQLLHEESSWAAQYVPFLGLYAFFCDNLDGNAARLNDRVTVLGEALDHGLDYVVAVLEALVFALQLNAKSPLCVAFLVLAVQNGFFFANMRHYITRTMLFKSFGPFEANIVYFALSRVIATCGPAWKGRVKLFVCAVAGAGLLESFVDFFHVSKQVFHRGVVAVEVYKKIALYSALAFSVLSTEQHFLLSFAALLVVGFNLVLYLILLKSSFDETGALMTRTYVFSASLFVLSNVLIAYFAPNFALLLKVLLLAINVLESYSLLGQLYRHNL